MYKMNSLKLLAVVILLSYNLETIPTTKAFITPKTTKQSNINNRSNKKNKSKRMNWSDTWNDILQGGSTRWKIDGLEEKKIAYNHIQEHIITDEGNDSDTGKELHILCPLAGDDPFVKYAFDQGHKVSAIDLVPAALAELRKKFEGEWSSKELESGHTVFYHDSGRASFYVGDALVPIKELFNSVDAVYDKDSFGALDISMRAPFAARLSEYCKPKAVLYTEVKNKPDKSSGPPFHVEKEDLITSFGHSFEHVKELGVVYDIPMPGMRQMGHILRRLA